MLLSQRGTYNSQSHNLSDILLNTTFCVFHSESGTEKRIESDTITQQYEKLIALIINLKIIAKYSILGYLKRKNVFWIPYNDN